MMCAEDQPRRRDDQRLLMREVGYGAACDGTVAAYIASDLTEIFCATARTIGDAVAGGGKTGPSG